MSQICNKLYVITRKDLDPSYQACQSGHALTEAIFKFRKEALEWFRESNTLVFLEANDEKHLYTILGQLENSDIKYAAFFEPDINNELTSIALMPGEESRKFCKRFKLAKHNPRNNREGGNAGLISRQSSDTLGFSTERGSTPCLGTNAGVAQI